MYLTTSGACVLLWFETTFGGRSGIWLCSVQLVVDARETFSCFSLHYNQFVADKWLLVAFCVKGSFETKVRKKDFWCEATSSNQVLLVEVQLILTNTWRLNVSCLNSATNVFTCPRRRHKQAEPPGAILPPTLFPRNARVCFDAGRVGVLAPKTNESTPLVLENIFQRVTYGPFVV